MGFPAAGFGEHLGPEGPVCAPRWAEWGLETRVRVHSHIPRGTHPLRGCTLLLIKLFTAGTGGWSWLPSPAGWGRGRGCPQEPGQIQVSRLGLRHCDSRLRGVTGRHLPRTGRWHGRRAAVRSSAGSG